MVYSCGCHYGSAKFIVQGYINVGQDTLYKMRWSPIATVTKGYPLPSYATDVRLGIKASKQTFNLYTLLNSYNISLAIPQYK